MHEIFHGWQRKAAIVSLGFACIVASLLVTSHVSCDITAFPLQGRQHTIITADDVVCWKAMATDKAEWTFKPDASIGYVEFEI